MDRLRAFEVFVTVVAQGGFARAAQALDTSPANVSRYVNELEAHLGTRLLNRSSRKLSLTASGEALYERSRSILDEVAEAEALASSVTLQPRGRLRITAPVSFGVLHLASLWPGFMRKYPDVQLDVVLSDQVVDLIDGGYDLAIRISRAGSTAHVARKLATSQNIVCASPAYLRRHGSPKVPADLSEHVCLGYSYSATADEWQLVDEAGKTQGVKVHCVMHANNGDTLRAAALAGAGISWQPTFLVADDLRQGRLVQLLPGHRMPDIDVLALYPSRRYLSAKVRMMVEFLTEAFAGTPPWDGGVQRARPSSAATPRPTSEA